MSVEQIKYQKTDISYPADKVLERSANGKIGNPATNYVLHESRVAYANLFIFLVMFALVVLSLFEYLWAAYSFVFALYTIFIDCLINKKIRLNNNSIVPTVDFLVIVGARAVFLSSLVLISLTVILVFVHTNILEMFLIPHTNFIYRINFLSLIVGLVIGITTGLLYIVFANFWEKISLQKYNSVISGQ